MPRMWNVLVFASVVAGCKPTQMVESKNPKAGVESPLANQNQFAQPQSTEQQRIEKSPTVAPTTLPVGSVSTAAPGTDATKQHLAGGWRGICAYAYNSQAGCNRHAAAPLAPSARTCPEGFQFLHVAARFQQAAENDARNEDWVGVCIRTASTKNALALEPRQQAVAGGWYGLCVYDHDGGACDHKLIPPMQRNKTCPEGFRFQHVAARYEGRTDRWVATCMATETGSQAARPEPGTLLGICAYDHDENDCDHGQMGVMGRRTCPAGQRWSPFAARYRGETSIWTGTCLME